MTWVHVSHAKRLGAVDYDQEPLIPHEAMTLFIQLQPKGTAKVVRMSWWSVRLLRERLGLYLVTCTLTTNPSTYHKCGSWKLTKCAQNYHLASSYSSKVNIHVQRGDNIHQAHVAQSSQIIILLLA